MLHGPRRVLPIAPVGVPTEHFERESYVSGDDVKFEVRDRVAYITINRPQRMNALSLSVMATLVERFSQVNDDPNIWAAVITGAGDQAFSAGADLKEMDDRAREDRPFQVPMGGTGRNLHETVLETYKPTIASINGWVLAGGCELALACDLRIATDHSKIGMPEAKRGMGANFASVLLPRLVPHAIALEMLYTGEPMDANEALRWGLFNKVVPKEKLEEETEKLVRRIVANAPLTLRRYKEMVTKGWDVSPSLALRLNVGPNPYLSEDREEGVRAFVEKRAPRWQGR